MGRICRRLENETSRRVREGQRERGRKSQRLLRLQSRHLEGDTIVQEGQGGMEVKRVDTGVEQLSRVLHCHLLSYLVSLFPYL